MGTPKRLCPVPFQREAGTRVLSLPLTTKLKGVCYWLFYTMRGEEGSHGTRATPGGLNIIGKRSKLEVRRNFYSQRVVDSWNGLSKETKLAKTVAEFKWRLRTEKKH